ncbi:MAG: hypothetical protein JRD64_05090 [Deltaproteobacteria bacterium]|jgi:hypothetical protein|nr:hypothetical protein [Deltaproteobacteria bacterium]
MNQQNTFGNADLAKKIASRSGTTQQTVKVKMRYNGVVQKFILKIAQAHKKAAVSTLRFG